MEHLIGLCGKDFVLIAASKSAVRGITVLKSSDDKSRTLNPHCLLAYSGEAGDTVHFAEYIQANVQLYGMRNEHELNPSAVAAFTRKQLAKSLRSRKPYQVNLLLGGYDTKTKTPHLYWIDYLAAQANVPYAAQGYAAYYCLSIMDRYHKPDISLEEGLSILRQCIKELELRMPIDFKGVIVKVVDEDGVREISV